MSSDITLEDTINRKFTTRQFSTGAPFTLAGTPVVSIYEDNNVTEITAGITLGVDHDGKTGLNLLTVVATAANGYESGKDYSAVITTGTVDGVSVIGEVVLEFTIGRSAAAVDLANGTDGLSAIKTLIDAIKEETDKLTLGNAGVGSAGSIIEEIENRAQPSDVPTVAAIRVEMDDNSNDFNSLLTLITAARMGALDDWIDAGRLDLLLDAIKAITDQFVFTVANQVNSNVKSISDDVPAADNLESQYDTTGLTGDTFPSTQSQLSGIANVGSAVNTPAKPSPNGFVITTGGTEVNDEDSTPALDGVYHQLPDNGSGVLEAYYEFNVGAGIPTSVTWTGYLTGNNDTLGVYGWDWIASAWVQIGTLQGKNSIANEVNSYEMFIGMVGSGGDEGTVRVRFQNAGLTSALLSTDQIFVSFSLGASGYANGAIWINTNISNTNTVPGIDGTERNPVSTIAAALTLSASTNLDKFQVSPGSTITLGAAFTNKEMDGQEWILALDGRDISGSGFTGATVTGIGTGTGPRFTHCDMGAVTLPADSHVINCGLEGDQTFGAAGDFFYDKCYSRLANDAAVVFDFGAALNASSLSVRHQSGGVEVQNMGAGTGSYLMSLEGFGQLIINANCSATSAISIRGTFTLTDNAGGAVTLTDDARIDIPQIRDGLLPTQNVAFSNIPFIFVAASDHVTPVTGATGMSVTRSIDGGAFGAGTGTMAEVGNGSYQYDASAADMNGGIIQFRFIATGGTPGAPDDSFLTIVTGGGV